MTANVSFYVIAINLALRHSLKYGEGMSPTGKVLIVDHNVKKIYIYILYSLEQVGFKRNMRWKQNSKFICLVSFKNQNTIDRERSERLRVSVPSCSSTCLIGVSFHHGSI